MREVILAEVLDTRPADTWQDIAGLQGAKQASKHAHTELFRIGGSDPPTEPASLPKGRRLWAF